MNFTDKITYHFLRAISKVIAKFSLRNQVVISQHIASILYYYIPKRRKVAIKNLKTAFPKYSDIWIQNTLKKCYKFFIYNFIQFLAFPKSTDSIKIQINGQVALDNALEKGKGVILISAHFGAWEILGHWLGVNNYPLRGVAQRQKNKGANKFFEEKRQLSGIKHIYRKVGMDVLYNILKENKILGLVSDQDAKNKGIFVNFFNTPASTHKGAAIFHLNTSAPMIFGLCIQTGFQEYKIELIPIIPVNNTIEDITKQYTLTLEKIIRKYPEQNFWFHNRWKTTPMK
ncbi:MAG: lysophospholipid acyltransferase family protein [SAR202 cluster bacterium]|nr:lysophospholipid acyltransferase family protein [SAR202 cluster bacterium]